jgi:hypothetical protein
MDITSIEENWVRGTLRVNSRLFAFSAKVYAEPSKDFGITKYGGDGHISKLTVTDERNEEVVINYDRGWDVDASAHSEKIVAALESDEVISGVLSGIC